MYSSYIKAYATYINNKLKPTFDDQVAIICNCKFNNYTEPIVFLVLRQ